MSSPIKYIKLTTKDNTHNNFIYKEGLNADPIPLNNKECEAGGLNFTDMDNWIKWIKYNNRLMYWLWDCEPVGEIVSFDDKYKAQSIILSNPRCIWKDKTLQLEVVKQNSYAIQYIKNPSEDIQLEAVKQNGHVIQFISNPSEEVQLAAVKKNGQAIKWIKNPNTSESVILEAIKQDGWAIKYVQNPSETLQLEAVKQDTYAIYYIHEPSKAVKLASIYF
jgi:hypothetical protein